MADINSALRIRNGDTALGEDEIQIKTKVGSEVDVDITTDTVGLAKESGGNLDTIAGDTTSIDGKTPALGQAAKAASVPVTLASDEDTIDVNVVSEIATNRVDDVDLATGVASGSSSTHQYQNTTGSTVYLTELMTTGSAPTRTLVYVGPLGTTSDPLKYAGFTTAASPNLQAKFEVEVAVPNNDYVTLIKQNRGSGAADIYSRIAGTY